MKLDRNNGNGRGKYALIKLREVDDLGKGSGSYAVAAAIETLERYGVIDWGERGSESEFFVMRLKDRSSRPGLLTYSADAQSYDGEWAEEVRELASRAGPLHPACKTPD